MVRLVGGQISRVLLTTLIRARPSIIYILSQSQFISLSLLVGSGVIRQRPKF